MVEIDVGFEACRRATDDRQHQGKLVAHRAHDRFRAAADADPGAQGGFGGRIDGLIAEGRAGGARPGDARFADQPGKEVEAFLEQRLVVFQVEAEEREALDEGPAPDDDLGAATGDGIKRRESLEDADGIVGGEDRDAGAEADAGGAGGHGGEDRLGRRDREIGAMMLAERDHIDPNFVGQHPLLHHVADDLRLGLRGPVRAVGDVAKGVEAEFEGHRLLHLLHEEVSPSPAGHNPHR